MSYKQEWWAVELRESSTHMTAIEAAFDYIDALERGEPEAMSFDEWADRMAVMPVLTIDDVEEILEHQYPTIGIKLARWLAEAKAKANG